MKESQTELINKNKEVLDLYLNDFNIELKNKILESFNTDDFNVPKTIFVINMKKVISMPKVGKKTLNYWTSRGWSIEESKIKRVKIKRDASKSPMNIEYWTKKGYNLEESEYKIKSLRKTNIEYWLEKGYSIEDAKIKRSEFQRSSNSSFISKYKDNEIFRNEVDSKKSNTILYWTSRGYSLDESIKRQSDRQKTFSKEKCIDKYGKEKGVEIWEKRQEKWMNSLKKSDYDGITGKSVNISKKIDTMSIENLIYSLSIKNKEIFIDLFNRCNNIDSFISEYIKTIDSLDEIYIYKILLPIKRLKVIKEFYNTTEDYIMSLIIPKISRVRTSTYSCISWFNNHICRSDGEYIIANFLFRNNIKYSYEKRYDNSNYKTDFYLIDYNLYVEYMGMKPKSYENKIKFLNKNNINYISSNNIDDIKKQILNYVNNYNGRSI